MKNFEQVNFPDIEEKIGKSSRFIITTNDYDTFARKVNLDIVVCYQFTKKELINNPDILALLFGRVNSKGVFKGSSTTSKMLKRAFIDYAFDAYSIASLEEFANENGYTNLGIANEYFLVSRHGGKHGSIKQDKQNKQDVLILGHYAQIKTSIATTKTRGSFSTTND